MSLYTKPLQKKFSKDPAKENEQKEVILRLEGCLKLISSSIDILYFLSGFYKKFCEDVKYKYSCGGGGYSNPWFDS